MEEMADPFDSVCSVQSTSNINRTKFIGVKYKIIYGVIQFFSLTSEPLEMTDENKILAILCGHRMALYYDKGESNLSSRKFQMRPLKERRYCSRPCWNLLRNTRK